MLSRRPDLISRNRVFAVLLPFRDCAIRLPAFGASTVLNGQPAINLINTISGAPLTADQEFQAGFTCNGVRATPTTPLPFTCPASQFGSALIRVPAPGTEN